MKKEIFVFETDECGYHNSESGKLAIEKYGAKEFVCSGYYGNSYAIPVLDMFGDKLSLNDIQYYINRFIEFTKSNKRKQFVISKICTELFKLYITDIPKNVTLLYQPIEIIEGKTRSNRKNITSPRPDVQPAPQPNK